ncbi:F-box/LRR-repeat protein [Dirofilaria immitis]
MWKKSFDDIDNYTYRKGDVIRENDDTNNYLVNDDSRSMCYPISEAFLRQKRRWKFLEWFPQCYHPCSINSLYLRILALPSISHSYSPPSKNGKLIDKSLPKLIISKEFSNDMINCNVMLEDLPEHIHIEILKKTFQARNHVEKICISASSTKQFPENMLVDLFPSVMQHVKVLDIGFYAFLSALLVEFFLKCFPNLEELNMEGIKTIGSFVYSTFLTKGFPNLKKLFISYCAPFSREDYRQFCLVNRPIEVLSVDGDAFLGNYAAVYLATSSFINTLTRLYLDGEGLNDFGFHALTACKNLNLLSISFCEDLTDISLSYVKTLTKLEHLHLRKGKEFTSEGLLELFELSSDDTEFFGRLRFLNLSECPSINDSVVNRITKRCPKLQSLNLAWDWLVTDAGLILITERLM